MAAKRTTVPAPQAPASSPALDELTGAVPRLVMLATSSLRPHPANPRRGAGDPDALVELVSSVQAQGVRQPLTVVPITGPDSIDPDTGHPLYRVVIGHRRLLAATTAGLPVVPALVEDLDDVTQRELMLVENLQRADLSPVEEADGYQGLLDLGVDVETIARSTGRSASTVRRRLKLVGLPERAREAVHTHAATLEDVAALEEFEDRPEDLAALADTLGTRDFRNEMQKIRDRIEREQIFDPFVERLRTSGAQDISDDYPSGTEGLVRAAWATRWSLRSGGGSASEWDTSAEHLDHVIDQAGAGWAFAFRFDELRVYRPRTDEEAAAQAALSAEREQRMQAAQAAGEAERRRFEEGAEQHRRFTALRTEFVGGLKARRLTAAQTSALAEFVARRELRTLWTEDGQYPGDDELVQWLGVETSPDHPADEDDAVVFAAIADLDAGHALLAFAVLVEEDCLGRRDYASDRAGGYYGLLEALGYVPSSEEVEALTTRDDPAVDDEDEDDEVDEVEADDESEVEG